jgi:glycosyltransferase involved in cell wall biosynthesis
MPQQHHARDRFHDTAADSEGRPVGKPRKARRPAGRTGNVKPPAEPPPTYERALGLADAGRIADAERLYERLAAGNSDPRRVALAQNDLATLAAARGDRAAARDGFAAALRLDPGCAPARHNLTVLDAPDLALAPLLALEPTLGQASGDPPGADPSPPVRVAVVSFLFNWPSTGGGIVHTVELGRFLREAGYDVRHVYARFDPWGIGRVDGPLPFPSECLEFGESDWRLPTILGRFRAAVDACAPDYVVVTDSWNVKPLLADALRGHRVVLRLQAMECLCPLNNVRLLPGPDGTARQCPMHQLATPDVCRRCLAGNGHTSGGLHRAERDLCGVGTPVYDAALRRAFRDAEAVLVVNPLTEALVGPYARSVRVVTAGMDPARFPWPPAGEPAEAPGDGPARLLFAGLVGEWMKGFHVLHDACERLWAVRRDFELLATADPPGRVDAFTRYVGWLSQAELPRQIRAADVLVMPTVAQEGLGRTAVEAMACGRPVVASRIGGLPATVLDGATGLLCEPGDPADLARQLARLLDDPDLRARLGAAGRRRFEDHYSWPVIIERHYRPLFTRPPAREGVGVPIVAPRYAPVVPDRVDQARLQDAVAALLGLTTARAMGLYRGYRALHERERYAERLGEYKTLCFEEAFVLYAVMTSRPPQSLAVVGTRDGRSARRLLDMRDALGLDAPLICFDAEDHAEHLRAGEAQVIIRDLTGHFRAEVLDARPPGLVFLDVHPHALLREAVDAVLADRRGWVLAIQSCGRGLCNPAMALGRDDPGVTTLTGLWERHVLAEAFGIRDPLDPGLDAASAGGHRLRVFDTPHGLAVMLPA